GLHRHGDGVRRGTRQLHRVAGQHGRLDRLPLQGRSHARLGPGDPDAEIRVAPGWVSRLRRARSIGPAGSGALGPVPVMRHRRPMGYGFATIAVVVAALVPPLHVPVRTPWLPLHVPVLTPWPPLPSGEAELTTSPLSGTERRSGGEDLPRRQGVRTLEWRASQGATIPLAEHPRPDFQREQWQNLNGPWEFQLDAKDEGEARAWFQSGLPAPRRIVVPFPWGSPLSGVPDSADIGWYARTIEVPAGWTGRRVFLVIGAADWRTTAWLDGRKLGLHDGGYVPFEFELTTYLKAGQEQRLVLRVDDAPRAFKLEGKQGYGNARGIWQTPYLEARGRSPLRTLHFTPDIDRGRVVVAARLLEKAPRDLTLTLHFRN